MCSFYEHSMMAIAFFFSFEPSSPVKRVSLDLPTQIIIVLLSPET